MTNRAWYVVYSKSQSEELAQFHLQLKGLDCFFPRMLLPVSVQTHRRAIPLFPNYLFVRIHLLSQYHQVIWSPGVKYLVSAGGNPLPVDDDVVGYLRQRANSEEFITVRSSLKAGQKVQVGGGPFEGLEGIIQHPPDARGRVKVLMNLLSREIKVDLPARFFAGAWVPEDHVV